MNAKQFYDLVVKMRQTQREYFKTRSKQVLEESKRLEKQVDDEIARVTSILSEQKKLF